MWQDEQFTNIAQKYIDMIFRVAFNYLKERTEADDVTQEVLVKLYLSDKVFESDDHLKNWLIRVTINSCKKVFLAPWRKTRPLESYAKELTFVAPEHSDLFEQIKELPRNYRLAIYLYYYEGYSTEEVAALLNRPKATIATWLHRGRQQLKIKLLEEYDD